MLRIPRSLAREHDRPEEAAIPACSGRVAKPGLHDLDEIADQLDELGLVQPHRGDVVGDPVAPRIDFAAGEIALEVADEAGHEGEERLPVLVRRHLRPSTAAAGSRRPERVGAFDGTPHPTLGHDCEDSALDKPGDMAIEAGGGDAGQFAAQATCRERTTTKEGLHYAKPQGV